MTSLPGTHADLGRIPKHTRRTRRAAVRAVASRAHDAEDCRLLLMALGLEARDGR